MNAVIEATKVSEPAVIEAWLLERGQAFNFDANALVALADAGVPSRVTDALVAVSNPKAFAVARPDGRRNDDSDIVGRRILVPMDPSYGWGGRYGYGYGYGLGYSPYDYYGYGSYGRYGPGYYYPPVVIVSPGTVVGGTSSGHGQVIKGRGYTQNETGSSSSSSSARPASSSTGSPSSSGSSSSSGTQSSTPAPAPAQTETRTAKPRP